MAYGLTLYFVLASDGWTLVLIRFTVGRSDAISYELGPPIGRHIKLVLRAQHPLISRLQFGGRKRHGALLCLNWRLNFWRPTCQMKKLKPSHSNLISSILADSRNSHPRSAAVPSSQHPSSHPRDPPILASSQRRRPVAPRPASPRRPAQASVSPEPRPGRAASRRVAQADVSPAWRPGRQPFRSPTRPAALPLAA